MFSTNFITLIPSLGYTGLFAIVFLESGIFFGFFLPGDSVLFSAGLLASRGLFNIWLLVSLLATAAILGDTAGYWFGKKVGTALFSKKDSLFFKQIYVTRVQEYYKKFGAQTVIIARFIPGVRTFAPILAGVAQMPYKLFLRYNIVGGMLWSVGVTLLGFSLGTAFPQTEHYLLPIIAAIILLSAMPIFIEWVRNRR